MDSANQIESLVHEVEGGFASVDAVLRFRSGGVRLRRTDVALGHRRVLAQRVRAAAGL